MNERRILKVRLRNANGDYLAARGGQWEFDPDVRRAVVLDYLEDRVGQQLELLEKNLGLALQAVPLPPWEIYETCDRCECLLAPVETFFDGKEFLCPECRGSCNP